MEAPNELAIHESAELQSLFTFKNSCLAKINKFQKVVDDDNLTLVLKSFMDKDMLHIDQLKQTLEAYDIEALDSFDERSTDEVVAYDLLMTAKASLMHYAAAIAEAPTYDVRVMLQRQLDDAIGAHEQVMNYMINKKWYSPYGDVSVKVGI